LPDSDFVVICCQWTPETTRLFDKDRFAAMARDMGRDQHPRIGPEPRHGRVLEFTDIDIERSASYVIAAKRGLPRR
jgi:hypothetical protein